MLESNMQRISFLPLLIGACVMGSLMFLFLKQANHDRAELAEAVTRETVKAQEAKTTAQKLVEETNAKLAAANTEISHAQQAVKSLQEERSLLLRATTLEPPNTRALKGWKEAVNASLGISCKFPPGSLIELNDAQALTLVTSRIFSATSGTAMETRWLSLTPYDARAEAQLLAELATSTPVSYVAHDYLWIGVKGARTSGSGELLVLQMRKEGKTPFLLWIKISPGSSLKTALGMLATFTVAS